jgi:carboxyl-terminal processing protease
LTRPKNDMKSIRGSFGTWYSIGFCLLIGGADSVPAQPCLPLQEYDQILSIVTENFFDREFNGLDWASEVSAFRSQVDCSDSPAELASVVNSLLEKLDASHTALYTKSDQHYWGLNSYFWRSGAFSRGDTGDAYQIHFSGIWAEYKEGKWLAQFVLDDSPAQRAAIVPGDELIAINGIDFHPLGFSVGNNLLTVLSLPSIHPY